MQADTGDSATLGKTAHVPPGRLHPAHDRNKPGHRQPLRRLIRAGGGSVALALAKIPAAKRHNVAMPQPSLDQGGRKKAQRGWAATKTRPDRMAAKKRKRRKKYPKTPGSVFALSAPFCG